jgi:hypothetical protein
MRCLALEVRVQSTVEYMEDTHLELKDAIIGK